MNTRSASPLGVHDLRCEYQANPLGIDVVHPRLSWKLVSDRRGIMQSAYQLRVRDEHGDLWDTAKVMTDQSIHVPYSGPALQSGQRYTWQVRVWDDTDQPSAWSDPAWWEMGLLHASDWQSAWIEPCWEEDPKTSKPCPYLRTTFHVNGSVASARVYITAHGLYELSLNGSRVGDAYFTPGFTSYPLRLQYQTYDVTALLHAGEDVVGVILGDGWYRGNVSALFLRNVYGDRLALLLQLHIRYADGREQFVLSDEHWQAASGPIKSSDLKDGEVYDARLEMPGWDQPGFDGRGWRGVTVVNQRKDHLVATTGPLVRCIAEVTPVEILSTPNGETVVDMGQNFAGIVRLKVQGEAGTTITLRHGETLDKHGNFTMENLQAQLVSSKKLLQAVRYTLKGGGEEVYTPHFTYHGFRYVQVEGFHGTPRPDQLTGLALSSDLPHTGTFECSNPLINQLQHTIEWSHTSNALEIPTDNPTRERTGWTGDAQLFARTGSFLRETASFLTKWLKDLAAEQAESGRVGNAVPNPQRPPQERGVYDKVRAYFEGSAGWGDAAVMVPWTLYQCYGDRRILEEQYPSMQAWVEYERKRARHEHWSKRLIPASLGSAKRRAHQRYIWDTNYHWGEWLEPDESKNPKMAVGVLKRLVFSAPLVATAYFANSTCVLTETARVLGKDDDAREYEALYQRIKEAYIAEFIHQDGWIRPEKQASYVRALAFDLLPEALRSAAIDHLVGLIREANNHLGTGFLSTPYLCHILSENGCLDVAYDLLNQDTVPSWLYEVKKGATTIWEVWDGIREDGTPNQSLNNYAFGAIGSWLYQVVGGIEIGAPGYKQIIFQPQPGGGLTSARATYHSLYGEIASSWQLVDGMFTLAVTVPANTTAVVRLPGAVSERVTEGGQALDSMEEVKQVRQEGDTTVIDVGSGTYTFASPFETKRSNV
jgi:alpha-L-rhamnosidase